MNPTVEYAAQNKNKGAGVPKAFFNIGNKIVIKEAVVQFAKVLNAIKFG